MNEEVQEILFDLLAKKASYGLDAAEQRHLDELSASENYRIDESFDLTAAAIAMIDLDADEQMPAHLYSKIVTDADSFFGKDASLVDTAAEPNDLQPTFAFEPKRSMGSWLGWVVAFAACVALAVNIFYTRVEKPIDVVKVSTPAALPEKADPAKEFEKLVASANVIKATLGPVPKAPVELASVSGDIVWSDDKQAGYIKVRGLPKNEKDKVTYQLWIFDETQDAKYPIDGGSFDVNADGDIIIPIDARLKTKNPKLFAITIEKAGGVVVSDRKKMAALAAVGKTET